MKFRQFLSNGSKWLVCLLLASTCLTPLLSAVIVVIRQYHGKQVSCAYSGLIGVAKSCGTEGYARVFTGIVRSSVETGDTDKLLEVVPDEIFVGDSSDATTIVNQACLDSEIKVGDKWLFYLSRDPDSKTLVLSYASPSKPIGESEDDISMLRDLGHLDHAGILIGTINRLGDTDDESEIPLANHKVVAMNVATRMQYEAYTSEKGRFEFKLPVGTYNVTPAPDYGLREVKSLVSLQGSIPVEDHKCWEHNFAVRSIAAIKPKTDGTISGHVGSPDGKPFTVHPWVQILSVEGDLFTSAYVDAKGYFEAKNVKPGRYLVGLGIQQNGGDDIPIPIYYPSVRTKEEATIIELQPNEKRTNVDFQLPPEDVLKPLGAH